LICYPDQWTIDDEDIKITLEEKMTTNHGKSESYCQKFMILPLPIFPSEADELS